MDIVNLVYKDDLLKKKNSKKEKNIKKFHANDKKESGITREIKTEKSKKEKFEANLKIINAEEEEKNKATEEEENQEDDFKMILKNSNRRAGLGFEENLRSSKDRKINNLTKTKLLQNKKQDAEEMTANDRVAKVEFYAKEDSRSYNFAQSKKVIGVQPPSKKIKKGKK